MIRVLVSLYASALRAAARGGRMRIDSFELPPLLCACTMDAPDDETAGKS
jgi:hypothetical protein